MLLKYPIMHSKFHDLSPHKQQGQSCTCISCILLSETYPVRQTEEELPARVRLRRINEVLSLGWRSCNKLEVSGVDRRSDGFCTFCALVSSPSGPTFTWRLLKTADEETSLEELVWLGGVRSLSSSSEERETRVNESINTLWLKDTYKVIFLKKKIELERDWRRKEFSN